MILTINLVLEWATSILLLILGIQSTAYAYGWAGERWFGRVHWNPGFRRPLRWLGPLLILMSATSMILTWWLG